MPRNNTDPRVDAYIDALPEWQQAICRRVRDLAHGVDPQLVETIKRTRQPYFVLDGNVCALLAARDWINVFLYDGAIVPDPHRIITGGHGNKTARTVAIRRGETINEPALSAMLKQIVANNRAGGWRKLKARAGRRSMRHLLAAICVVVVCTPAQSVIAQSDERPVPIVQAPFHIPVFTNEYVTFLSITVPPGRNTGYHIHSSDSVSVTIEPADMTNQNFRSAEVSPPARGERGRATFAGYTKEGPRTHKASNVGSTPFHNLSFVLKHPGPQGFMPSSRAGVRGYAQILDNERVRGWRVVLDPGQVTGEIRQQAPGLRIVIYGGVLAEIVPGQADRGMSLGAGDFLWQDAGGTRAVRNTGTTRMEFLEFELK